MIWLDICDEQGNAIYFDIHHVEKRRVKRRWRHSVSGICGNGLFEVEVLVEPGSEGEVTFVDLSRGMGLHSRLLSVVDATSLQTGLLEAASRHCGLPMTYESTARTYPHYSRSFVSHMHEPEPAWESFG